MENEKTVITLTVTNLLLLVVLYTLFTVSVGYMVADKVSSKGLYIEHYHNDLSVPVPAINLTEIGKQRGKKK